MDGLDHEAEAAIREAIENLVASGKRAYSLSVPFAAERWMISKGRGRISAAEANPRIRSALAAMVERGELEAYSDGYRDWVLHDRSVERPHAEHGGDQEWDAFISHASEDKDDCVRELAERLTERGLRVWYDESTLKVGDSLRRSIDKGLARSRFGIVVISPAFLQKEWPQRELDGLVAREVEGVKVILPVWHNVSASQIRAYSPTLADRLAASTDKGLVDVTARLIQVIRPDEAAVAGDRPNKVDRITAQSARNIRVARVFAREYHEDRVRSIASASAAAALQSTAAFVMHLVPQDAVNGDVLSNFDKLANCPARFLPIGSISVPDFRIGYDGLLIGSAAKGLDVPQRAYVTVSRSGILEAVDTSIGRGRDGTAIQLPLLDANIVKYTQRYAEALTSFGATVPIVVVVGLVGVKNMTLLQTFIEHAFPEDVPSAVLNRETYYFGEAVIATVPKNDNESAGAVRPILTHLANASGLASSPSYGLDGKYIRRS